MDTHTWITIAVLITVFNVCMCSFDVTIEPPFAHPGQEVRITCNVRDEQSRVTFEWYRRGADGVHTAFGVNDRIDPTHYLGGRELSIIVPTDDDVIDNVAPWTLIIPAAALEDTADWGCNTAYNEDSVAHLTVITHPGQLLMYGAHDPISAADAADLTPFDQDHTITVQEESQAYVMCVANEFNPQPELSLTFNGKPLNGAIQECTQESRVAEGSGYVYNVYNCAITSANSLKMEPQANRLPLECSATVQGTDGELESVIGVIRPVIEVAPEMTCSEDVLAIKNEKNITFTCTVVSSPEPDSIKMKWSTGPTEKEFDQELEGGENSENRQYKSKKIRREDGIIDVHFIFPRVTLDQFRNYTIVATNRAGSDTHIAALLHDVEREPTIPPSTKPPPPPPTRPPPDNGGHGNTPNILVINTGLVIVISHLWKML